MSTDAGRPGPSPGLALAQLALSLLWLLALTLLPALRAGPAALAITLILVTANFATVLFVLAANKRLLVGLSVVQLGLFTLAHVQVYTALGHDHYRCDRPPTRWDWPAFTAAHVLHAADVLDVLEEYGIDVQHIHHRSDLAGVLLVALHLSVDLFLLTLAVRVTRRAWRRRQARLAARDRRRRQEFYERPSTRLAWLAFTQAGGTLTLEEWLGRQDEPSPRSDSPWKTVNGIALNACLVVVVAVAIVQRWHPVDWVLWPLDQLVRVADVGDAMQVFGWRLHDVPESFAMSTLAVAFRLLAGTYALRWLNRMHLRLLGGAAIKTVDDYLDALADDDADVRADAARALGDTGEAGAPAVPALAEQLLEPDGVARRTAAAALRALGSAAVPELIGLLADRRAGMRCESAETLARLGRRAVAAAPALVDRLEDAALSVRDAAERALVQIGAIGIPVLIERFARRRCAVRPALLRVLWELDRSWVYHPEGRKALQALIEQTRDENPSVRRQAAEAIGQYGLSAPAAVPALARSLSDEEPEVRAVSAWALGRIGPDARWVVPPLVDRLADPVAAVRSQVAEALAKIRPEARQAAEELARLIADPDPRVRAAASEALDVIEPMWRTSRVATG